MPGSIPAAVVNTAKEYRERSERLREEAVTALPEIRESLLELARRFDSLATTVERTARQLSRGESGNRS